MWYSEKEKYELVKRYYDSESAADMCIKYMVKTLEMS